MIPTRPLPESEALWFLGLVELGVITLTTSQNPPYWGDVDYYASNGWMIRIFGDCGDWDYVDSISTPGGRVWLYPDDGGDRTEVERQLMNYRPDESVCLERYGFWGYLVNEAPG